MTSYIRDGRAPIPERDSTSRLMRANKAKDTKPEVILRQALWRSGLRGYRLHHKQLPGRPDIAFNRGKVAVFINGCFWHRCPTCDLPLPKSNTAFWKNKFDMNVARDKKKVQALKDIGWCPIIIWECKIGADPDSSVRLIQRVLTRRTRV